MIVGTPRAEHHYLYRNEDGEHGCGYRYNRKGKAEPGGEESQQRRNNDAASACSVQRPTHSQPTASVEPRCDDDVDRCAAHSGPPNGHHGERRINMPEPGNKCEQHHSARHRNGPYHHNFSCAVTIKEGPNPEE